MPLILDAPNQLRDVVELAASHMLEHPGALDDRTLMELLAKLRDLRAAYKALGDVVKAVDAACCRQADWNQVVEGFGVVEKKRGYQRSAWDHDGLFAEVFRVSKYERTDPMTGEIVQTEAQALLRIIKACAAVSYWRKGELASRGVEINDFCEKKPGRESIVFVTP